MTLTKDLALFNAKPEELNPYEAHFLFENPFPDRGETGFDICTDQNAVKKEFIYGLQHFSETASRLQINGASGAGKTNILQYFERLTHEARRNKFIKNLYPIYINSPGESYFNIHGQIIDKLVVFFLNDLIGKLQADKRLIKRLSLEIKSASELLKVIKAIAQPTQQSYLPWEERQKDAFLRWIKGQQKLIAADKKLLTDDGVPPIDITNSLACYAVFVWTS